ncbi:MAG: dihydroorotate dehydrogenase electron transfer subunit [Clostridiales bacterium]|nr:dihydroorotate dehydrogenase electron transfer subunit [Clostridiales bacterium]
MRKLETATVISQIEIADGVCDLRLYAPGIAKRAVAGQFVNVYSSDASRLLPRPISLCGIDAKAGTIRLVYRIVGEGTLEFSGLCEGDYVSLMGPLGNGFTTVGKKAMIVGGGIGIPPMLEMAKVINQKERGMLGSIVLGYRDSQTFLLKEFEEQGRTVIATEDGSLGTRGNVLDAIRAKRVDADVVYACGPKPMLRALKEYAQSMDMECYISMEERMACGIGACLACVCRTKEPDSHTNVCNARVCVDGPVFDARAVEL